MFDTTIVWLSTVLVVLVGLVARVLLAEFAANIATVIEQRRILALDANGIVLWIADPDGKELSPILAHGYPPKR